MKQFLGGVLVLGLVTSSHATTTVNAQGLGSGRGTGAANQAQAQVQQRVQSQAQAQVQTRIQQQAQRQTQAQLQSRAASAQSRINDRIKADTARAIGLTKRLEATQGNLPSGVGADANASASLGGGFQGGANRSRANTNVVVNAGGSTATAVTNEDVQVYDEIFGQFNPLRKGQSDALTSGSKANGKGQNFSVPPSERGAQKGMSSVKRPAFATQIVMAAQERRAEIAQLRDRAVAVGDTATLARADEMELRLNAFVEANAASSEGRQNATTPATRTAKRPNGGF